jgi:hypothetical protein
MVTALSTGREAKHLFSDHLMSKKGYLVVVEDDVNMVIVINPRKVQTR